MLWLSILIACQPSSDDTGVDTALVEETFLAPDQVGPWIAGTYEDVAPGPDGVELTVQVWFPASEADDEPYSYSGYFEYGAMEDGVPDCAEPRPVMVFSHGNTGMRFQSVYLTERLASRGWVVVAPDHTFNTFLDHDNDMLGEVMFRRPGDVAASFDWLVGTAAAAGGPLEGCVDESAGYAVAGHSFGGFTAAAVAGAVIDPVATADYCGGHGGWLCDEVATWAQEHPGEVAALGDARAWASVPMAPAGYEALMGGLADVTISGLVLGGSRDTTTSMGAQVTPIFEGWGGRPAYLGEIADAGHYTFSNACDLVPTFDDCEEPYIEPAQAYEIINTVTTAFLGQAMGDDRFDEWLPPDDERLDWTVGE